MGSEYGMLVVEDQALVSDWIEHVVGQTEGYALVKTIRSADMAYLWCSRGGIDLVIMDVYTGLGADKSFGSWGPGFAPAHLRTCPPLPLCAGRRRGKVLSLAPLLETLRLGGCPGLRYA